MKLQNKSSIFFAHCKMFKCCVSGAKEDVEEAKKERAKRDQKQSNPSSRASAVGNDGRSGGMTNTSGSDDVGPPALGTGLGRGQSVASGA